MLTSIKAAVALRMSAACAMWTTPWSHLSPVALGVHISKHSNTQMPPCDNDGPPSGILHALIPACSGTLQAAGAHPFVSVRVPSGWQAMVFASPSVHSSVGAKQVSPGLRSLLSDLQACTTLPPTSLVVLQPLSHVKASGLSLPLLQANAALVDGKKPAASSQPGMQRIPLPICAVGTQKSGKDSCSLFLLSTSSMERPWSVTSGTAQGGPLRC
mmetsp:Transcript_48625/g.113894  ORF Transcript_48625/g.113894 Transcript_48625/m.113894 type:complete len:214 (+) Transcript_48625:384-1025(+)